MIVAMIFLEEEGSSAAMYSATTSAPGVDVISGSVMMTATEKGVTVLGAPVDNSGAFTFRQ